MKNETEQVTEQAVRDILQRPEGQQIIREAGRIFAGALFGKAPVLEHTSVMDHGDVLEKETVRIKGGVPDYLLGRIRLGYRLECAMKALRDAFIALGGSAGTYFMYKRLGALAHEDYSTACELLQAVGIPEDNLDNIIDEIMKTIVAHMGTVPGGLAWGLMCGMGHNAFREHGVIFEAAA